MNQLTEAVVVPPRIHSIVFSKLWRQQLIWILNIQNHFSTHFSQYWHTGASCVFWPSSPTARCHRRHTVIIIISSETWFPHRSVNFSAWYQTWFQTSQVTVFFQGIVWRFEISASCRHEHQTCLCCQWHTTQAVCWQWEEDLTYNIKAQLVNPSKP